MGGRAGLASALFALALGWAGLAFAAPPAESHPFSDWAAVVIAGDFHGVIDTRTGEFLSRA